jgi:hypothetical protein
VLRTVRLVVTNHLSAAYLPFMNGSDKPSVVYKKCPQKGAIDVAERFEAVEHRMQCHSHAVRC